MAVFITGAGNLYGLSPTKLLSDYAEGDVVLIPENGVPVEFYVAKHDYESSLNGTGRTLLVRKDCHSQMKLNTDGKHNFVDSTIDTWLNGEYANTLSELIRNGISSTTINYTAGIGISTSVATISRPVFLLSLAEYGLSTSYANSEGEALPIADILKVANLGGTATRHWTRTPQYAGPYNVCIITQIGTVGVENGSSTYGVRPAFTLPATTAFSMRTNVIKGVAT